MLRSVGLDIVSVERIRNIAGKWGSQFFQRVFTEEEREICEHNVDPILHYAARFAAKEAVMKALGFGLPKGVAWKEIAIRKGGQGEPLAFLSGKALLIQRERNLSTIYLSLSHTDEIGMAIALAME